MKNKIFSKGLYAEGLRQNRLIGILFTVINTLIAVMIPLLTVFEQVNSAYITPTPVHFFSPTNSLFVLVFALLAPILTEHLFSFLNKRSTSDFYHSVPHTRVCLYVSYTLSIVTWIAIAIAVQTAASLIVFAIFPKYFALMYSTVLPTVLSIFAAALLVTATFLIGMALTGTVFNNMIISLLLLFLPRFVMTLVNLVITDSLPQILEGRLFPLFANKYNIVTSMAFGLFDYSFSFSELFASPAAIIYTFVLALIYFAIGGLLFHRRKSEMAGSSASSRRMQATFRILVCMTICIIPAMLIFSSIVTEDSYFEFSVVIVLYVLALIAFFVYEAITTKKWKNLLRAIPSLGIVFLLNVAVIAGMFGIYYSQLNYTPDAKDVKSFSFAYGKDGDSGDFSFTEYLDLKKENIRITDPKLIGYVTDALKFDVETYKKGQREYYSAFTDSYSDKEKPAQIYERIRVSFNSGLSKKYRMFFIPHEQYEEIINSFKTNPDVKDLYLNLPTALNGTVEINYMFDQLKLTAEEGNKIYAMMREEIRNCDYDKWYACCNTFVDSSIEIYFSIEDRGVSYRIRIRPDKEIMPKTCEMISDAYLKQQIDNLKLFNEMTEYKNTVRDININAEIGLAAEGNYVENFQHFNSYFLLDGTNNVKDADFEMIKWLFNNAVLERVHEPGDIVLQVYCYSWDNDNNKSNSCNISLPLDKAKMLENEKIRIAYEEFMKYRDEKIVWDPEPDLVPETEA